MPPAWKRAKPCITPRCGGGDSAGALYKRGVSGARDQAAELLWRLERSGGRVREALGPALGRLEDVRERGLLTELAYGCVRRQGTLDAVLAAASRRAVLRLHAAVRTALRLALYQVLFLDRVPAHAAVDHAVGWARARAGGRRAGYANAVLRALLRDFEGPASGAEDHRRDVPREDGSAVRFRRTLFPDPGKDAAGSLAGRFSTPRWLVARWLERWGEERAHAVLQAGITRPPLTLRARVAPGTLATTLRARDVAFEVGPGDTALRLAPGESGALASVRGGEAAVQDATSQRVAPLLAPQPGARVLDLCAAPGGKTVHLADLMGRGALTACDVDEAKVRGLEDLRPQLGEVEYEAVRVPPKGKLPFEAQAFDGVLVDAPCSNTGVLRRRVEARWRLKARDFDALAAIQVGLVRRALPLLKPGGRLVYATCSLEAEENEQVLERVLAKHGDFEGEVAFRAWPCAEADGGFAAILRHRR